MNINAILDGGLVFPIVGYEKNIKYVPKITNEEIEVFYKSRCNTSKHYKKSYKYLIEGYINSAALMSKADLKNDTVYVKAQCYHSYRKHENPHTVCAALKISSPTILDANCGCAAGIKGTCNHSISLLRLLCVLRTKDVSIPPNKLSCTDLPQQWNRPRGKKICPLSVIDINTQAPKEGGKNKPIFCKMYEVSATSADQSEVVSANKDLINNLNENGEKDGWASILPDPNECTWVQTRFGYVPEGSPLSLQIPLEDYGFDVIHNLDVFPSPIFNVTKSTNRFSIPSHTDSSQFTPWSAARLSKQFSSAELMILNNIEVNYQEAKDLEGNTRDQAESQLWKNERAMRLSSSMFGLVCKRRNQSWTQAGIRNIVNPKDIGHLNSIKYGKRFEEIAKTKYIERMKSLGHNVTVHTSGYIVDPTQCWLGTSPDGLVHDPKEKNPHGLLEIKCPSSMRDKTPAEALNQDFQVQMLLDKPVLNETHNHFYQIMGQMALSGLRWCDYVTYFPAGLIIVRVHFCSKKWEEMQSILKNFYFAHMLPKLAIDKKVINCDKLVKRS